MSRASEYAKAWAAIKCRAMTDAPALVALKSGIPGDLPLACVTRSGDLLTYPGDIKAEHIPALIAWLTDTFTDGGDVMAKYRKRPVIVEAFQWHPDMGEFGGVERDYAREGFSPKGSGTVFYKVRTLEGKHEVSPGDWIITGIKGERYPCKPDIFEATYEPADTVTDGGT